MTEVDQTDKKSTSMDSGWLVGPGFENYSEVRQPVELTVSGHIPEYASGTLFRVGPGVNQIKSNEGKIWKASHWFDGLSEVHRFEISPAPERPTEVRVMYSSRFTVDDLIERIRQTGRLDGISFGQKRDPCQSFFKKWMSVFRGSFKAEDPSPSMVNVGVTVSVNMPGLAPPDKESKPPTGHASGISNIFTKTDAARYQQLDPETLEPIGLAKQQDLHPDLKGPLSGAHAKSDPETADVYNFNLELGPTPRYRIFHVSAATGETEILAAFAAPAAYIHSLFLTSDHVVLCIWSSHLGYGGMQVPMEQNILDAIMPFDKQKPATFYVIDRRHGKGLLATYQADAFFCFHTVNAWTEPSSSVDDGGSVESDITVELSAYDDLDVLKKFYYDNLLALDKRSTKDGDNACPDLIKTRPSLRRFRLPAVPQSPTEIVKQAEPLHTAPKSASPELPTINPAYLTRRQQYTYGAADRDIGAPLFDGLVKWDHASESAIYWSTEGHTPGEAIFVADPNGQQEDDGVLLSVVLDGRSGTSYLLCLDAHNMEELGRASARTPVSFGFHGCHVSSKGTVVSGADS